MALTFPIDRMEPGEIPAFDWIFAQYPEEEDRISRMVKYLCYRFDPKFEAASKIPDQRRIEALDRSGFVGPGSPPSVDENGVLVIPADYQQFMDVTTMFFSILNNNDWEEICSLEFMLWEANEIMRTPIPTDASPDIKIKLSDLKIKLSDGAAKMSSRLKILVAEMADDDDDAKASMEYTAIQRKNRDMTGRKIK